MRAANANFTVTQLLAMSLAELVGEHLRSMPQAIAAKFLHRQPEGA